MFIAGKNSVFETLSSNKTINKVLIESSRNDEFSKKIVELCKKRKIRFDFVKKHTLDKLSLHHQGYVAEVTDFVYSEIDDILSFAKSDKFIVILDGIQDPQNFGSIIRVCECAGVDGIIIESRRSCSINETVYKTSCGAINHVKIAKVVNINDTIKMLKKQNIWIYACETDGEDVYKTNLKGNIAIVLGGEGKGVGTLTKKLCDVVVKLPMFGKVNSLNVSTATGAIIYEIVRQRNY